MNWSSVVLQGVVKMATTINGKVFNITISDGEVFYQHVDGALHTNTLKAVVRKMDLTDSIKVFDAKNGVFSVYGDEAVFWAKIAMEPDFDKKLDLLFAGMEAA